MGRRSYDWEFDLRGCNLGSILIDVLHPFLMLVKAIGRDSDDFDVALCEIFGATGDLTELRGADGGEISGMGEKNGLPDASLFEIPNKKKKESYPRVTDPVMELDGASGGLSLKVRSNISESERRHFRVVRKRRQSEGPK